MTARHTPYEDQREQWLAEHPDWDQSQTLPWPPPYDVPSPLYEPGDDDDA